MFRDTSIEYSKITLGHSIYNRRICVCVYEYV